MWCDGVWADGVWPDGVWPYYGTNEPEPEPEPVSLKRKKRVIYISDEDWEELTKRNKKPETVVIFG